MPKKLKKTPKSRVNEQITTLKPAIAMSLPFIWAGSAFLLILTTVLALYIVSTQPRSAHPIIYSTFVSKPQVLGAATSQIDSGDPRAQKLNKVFDKYKCPVSGLGDVFVKEADKHNIPYWLVASVAFQESNCGKKTPKKNGEESYNLYGWGVWGENIKTFDDYEHGIAVVSKYMSDKFYAKGITDVCEIMKIYTPPSNGSWCKGVKYFGDVIENYTSN